VTDKSTGGGTGGKLPETESLIPGRRQSVSAIRGDNLQSSAFIIVVGLEFKGENVHSRRRCGSDREESVLGSRKRSRLG
jgi:hypothetical protein